LTSVSISCILELSSNKTTFYAHHSNFRIRILRLRIFRIRNIFYSKSIDVFMTKKIEVVNFVEQTRFSASKK